MTTTTLAPARAIDLESRAIAMLDDDQLFATFIRWRTGRHGESTAPSLKDKLGVAECVSAIFAKVQ